MNKSVIIIAGVVVLVVAAVIFFTSMQPNQQTAGNTTTTTTEPDAMTGGTDDATSPDAMMQEESTDESLDGMENTIVDVAMANGNFETLVTAVAAADLVDTLSGTTEFTVFAPTDEAFAKLPEGTVENLLLPENKDQLIEILTYHVVPGKVMSTDVVNLTSATTVEGRDVTVSTTPEGSVKINDATVVTADVEASNGVIHVIDTVLIPE